MTKFIGNGSALKTANMHQLSKASYNQVNEQHTDKSMTKLLGIALLIGGSIIGLILLWLMNIYINEQKLSMATAVAFILITFFLLVIPQWIIGIYLVKTDKNHSDPT